MMSVPPELVRDLAILLQYRLIRPERVIEYLHDAEWVEDLPVCGGYQQWFKGRHDLSLYMSWRTVEFYVQHMAKIVYVLSVEEGRSWRDVLSDLVLDRKEVSEG